MINIQRYPGCITGSLMKYGEKPPVDSFITSQGKESTVFLMANCVIALNDQIRNSFENEYADLEKFEIDVEEFLVALLTNPDYESDTTDDYIHQIEDLDFAIMKDFEQLEACWKTIYHNSMFLRRGLKRTKRNEPVCLYRENVVRRISLKIYHNLKLVNDAISHLKCTRKEYFTMKSLILSQFVQN